MNIEDGDDMKNKIIYILSILFLFIPVLTYAEADIKSTSIIGNNSVTYGEEVTQNVYINFNGVEKNNQNSVGLWFVSFEIFFDEKVLELTEIESDDWLSYAAKDKNTWVISSFLYEDFTESNQCIDKETFCGSYNIKLMFKPISNSNQTTEISLGEIGALASNMGEDNELTITGNSNSVKTLTINKKIASSSSQNDNKETNKETNKEDKNNENNSEVTSKSSNRYLESLKIENYEIDFNKYNNDYEILVEENVTSLKVTAIAEHEKAKVTIIGAENFSRYNNKVEVVVVAENGTKNTYTINVKVKMNEEELDKELTKENKKKEFKITEKHLMIGGIVLGAIFIILIIRLIIIKINDHKIDKALDDL